MSLDEPIECTNSGCVMRLQKKTGMVTNGPCSCLRGLDTRQKIGIQRRLEALKKAYAAYVKLTNSAHADGENVVYVADHNLMKEFDEAFERFINQP